jgi:hypothetical protein
MTTQVFDDGSTLTYDYSPGGVGIIGATPATDYGINFSPSSMSPGANSFLDVLTNGFSRYVDYRIARDAPQNPVVRYQNPVTGSTGIGRPESGFSLSGNWMLYAGLGLAGLAVVAALMKAK